MKILIAEDSPVDAIFLRNIVEHDGHVPLVVQDGAAALAALDEHPDIAAVIADMRMPEVDGLELFATMRRRPELAGIPVIFVSAVAEAGLVRRAVAMGSDGYLLKPIKEPSRVLDLINRTMGSASRILDDPDAVPRRNGLSAAAAAALHEQLAAEVAAALEALDDPAEQIAEHLETLRRLSRSVGAERLAGALRAVAEDEDGAEVKLRRQLRALLLVLEPAPAAEAHG